MVVIRGETGTRKGRLETRGTILRTESFMDELTVKTFAKES